MLCFGLNSTTVLLSIIWYLISVSPYNGLVLNEGQVNLTITQVIAIYMRQYDLDM